MLWVHQLKRKNYIHFPIFSELLNKTTEYDLCILNFRAEFERRFIDFRQSEIPTRGFSSLF